MLDPRIELLEALPIFSSLTRKQLDLIAGIATKAFFEPGDTLITEGETGHAAYLIMTGTARALQFPASTASADRIGPGSLVAEVAMLVDTVHPFTIEAKERVRALTLHREALRAVLEEHPVIAQQLADNLLVRLKALAWDLRRFDSLLANIESAGVSSPVRLAC